MALLDFREIRRRIGIRHVLELMEYQPTSTRGQQCRGPCPFACSDTSHRCFSVNLERGVFRCFGCDRSGNQLDLWVAVSKLDLHQAALDLCNHVGLAAPEAQNTQPENRNF